MMVSSSRFLLLILHSYCFSSIAIRVGKHRGTLTTSAKRNKQHASPLPKVGGAEDLNDTRSASHVAFVKRSQKTSDAHSIGPPPGHDIPVILEAEEAKQLQDRQRRAAKTIQHRHTALVVFIFFFLAILSVACCLVVIHVLARAPYATHCLSGFVFEIQLVMMVSSPCFLLLILHNDGFSGNAIRGAKHRGTMTTSAKRNKRHASAAAKVGGTEDLNDARSASHVAFVKHSQRTSDTQPIGRRPKHDIPVTPEAEEANKLQDRQNQRAAKDTQLRHTALVVATLCFLVALIVNSCGHGY